VIDEGTLLLFAPCIGTVFGSDPDTVPSVYVDDVTRCTVQTDGTPIVPGQDSNHREPVCPACVPIIKAAVGTPTPLTRLFPHARLDLIRLPD
jgi:hypothetical protein